MHSLDGSGDVQASDAWCGKLTGVYVGNFPHSGVHVLQVLALHYQDGLSWVKVKLGREKTQMLDGERELTQQMIKCRWEQSHLKLKSVSSN